MCLECLKFCLKRTQDARSLFEHDMITFAEYQQTLKLAMDISHGGYLDDCPVMKKEKR